MKYKVVLKVEAIHDISEAVEWYEHQQSGLGSQFLDELDKYIDLISQNPDRYPLNQKQRIAVLHRFPYKIVFQSEGESIIIFAIYHDKRNPTTLTKRR